MIRITSTMNSAASSRPANFTPVLPDAVMTRIACIGECMIELNRPETACFCGYGGDTLNTAVYLARLGVAV